MPFRHTEALPLCSVCRTPTPTGCRRCGNPLCKSHLAACATCETNVARGMALKRDASLGLLVTVVATAGLSALITLGMATGVTGFWWLAGGLTGWAALFGYAHRRRLKALKRRTVIKELPRAASEPPER